MPKKTPEEQKLQLDEMRKALEVLGEAEATEETEVTEKAEASQETEATEEQNEGQG